MKHLYRMTSLAAVVALCCVAPADAAQGGGASSAPDAPAPTDAPKPADAVAVPAPDAPAEAAAARTTEDAETNAYRIKSDFHDTTTGRMRKKGKTVRATDKRAAALAKARVIETDAEGQPVPVDPEDEDEDEGEESVYARQDAASEAVVNPDAAHVAPVGLDGPVDEAVAREIEASGAGTTDGMTTSLTTAKVPGVVTGNKNRKPR